MASQKLTVTVRVNVEISPAALKTIVAMTKQLAGRNEKGYYRVDTADAVSRMISRFLAEKGFDDYVQHRDHYPS
jgi:hypothetical protein